MKKWRLTAAALTVGALMALGCAIEDHSPNAGDPVGPNPAKAVAQVAALYSVKPDVQPLKLDTVERGVPDSGTLQAFINRADITPRWQAYLNKLGVKQPRDRATVSIGSTGRSTKCPTRNIVDGAPSEVVSVDSDPFWCPTDGTYGQYYLPASRVAYRWRNAGASYPTAQVEEALFVWLAARWGDAYLTEIYEHARALWNMSDLLDPKKAKGDPWVVGQTMGYCLAGAFSFAAGLDRSTVVGSLTILFGGGIDGNRTPSAPYENAIEYGFNNKTPGSCIKQYWPKE